MGLGARGCLRLWGRATQTRRGRARRRRARARARDGAHGDANDARADRAIVADVDAMSRFARGVECGRRLGRTATRHPRARLEGSPRDENRARALDAGWTRVSSRRVMHNATRAPPRARWMEEVCVRVAYRGATHAVDVPSDATVGDLGVALERATGASVATQKIFGLKRVSSLKGGVLVPSRAGDATLAVASVPGLTSSANAKPLMLMGTAAADIAALDAASQVDHRVVGFDEELLRLRRRRKGHVSRGSSRAADSGPPSSAEHPYTFGEYRSLPVPDAIRPSAAAALRMLHKLARDPGILGVMAKHKFRVGLLSEMPPEGKVGVSESCVLGYNVNAGAEIHLRLRTDDLRGFRRYARVRETLLHELTHNVWSDHDGNFKALCSRLNAECAEFDWKANGNGARRLASDGAIASSDEETWSEDETMAATRGSSGRASGGGGDDAPRSAAEAAARRAAAAAAEAAERDMATLARDAIEAAFARRGGGDVPRDANVAGSKCACGACGAGPFEVSAARVSPRRPTERGAHDELRAQTDGHGERLILAPLPRPDRGFRERLGGSPRRRRVRRHRRRRRVHRRRHRRPRDFAHAPLQRRRRAEGRRRREISTRSRRESRVSTTRGAVSGGDGRVTRGGVSRRRVGRGTGVAIDEGRSGAPVRRPVHRRGRGGEREARRARVMSEFRCMIRPAYDISHLS